MKIHIGGLGTLVDSFEGYSYTVDKRKTDPIPQNLKFSIEFSIVKQTTVHALPVNTTLQGTS
jgi:hypothetical protein